jgi:hypothetical protein
MRLIHPGGLAPRLIFSLLLMGAGLSGPIVALGQLARQPHGSSVTDRIAGELGGPATIGQTIVTDDEGLYRVEVWLNNPRPASASLWFHLKTSPTATDELVTLNQPLAATPASGFYAFEFEPLAGASGASLYFYLEAAQADPASVIQVGGAGTDTYPAGRAVLVNVQGPADVQDLTFRLYYRPGLGRAVETLITRLAANKPGLLGQPAWYIFLGITYLVLLGALGWRLGGQNAAQT